MTSNQPWLGPDVWTPELRFEGNPVRQLLVPEAALRLQLVDGDLRAANQFGAWPAYRASEAAPAGFALSVPPTAEIDQPLRSAAWNGTLDAVAPGEVLSSMLGGLSFEEERPDGPPSLRRPQLGAVHAVLGYWTTERTQPATVVMPTGTGKTETMLALLVAGRPRGLLVIVPTDALREQIAAKFERLGVLQKLGIVSSTMLRPAVGRIEHGFTSVETATAFADACNVIVTTAAAINACTDAARAALLDACTHLFIDEAHHVAAKSWTDVRLAFTDKPVVQFTATPFREDGRHLGGRLIYSFPLRQAQQLGYFAPINYKSVLEFDDTDRALAAQAVAQLREDMANGYDHLMMARVSSIRRMHEVLPLYQELAQDLNPVLVNSRMSKRSQQQALAQVRDGRSRIIVCVNMLGEGFDLPALKVAAVHDPQRSLGVTLQFVGRFARVDTGRPLGEATVLVARKEMEVDKRLRALYAEDADWNLVLRNLSESAVEEQADISEFEAGFTSLPEEVTLRNLMPKMSTVVYRTPSADWQPDELVDHFGEENLFTVPIGLNLSAGVAWCIVEHHDPVRFGPLRAVEETSYELFVLYFDQQRRLLYINSSANSGLFEELAKALVGDGAERFTGNTVWRVMADIKRLIPTTVGVLDAVSTFRRFSMHVGSDVREGFSTAESQTKVQTNISASGYRDGERVNISASRKGRIWSHAVALTLKHWCDWCDEIGDHLLDDTISIGDITRNFLLPQELTGRPEAVLLALEWPWQVYLAVTEQQKLVFNDLAYPLIDVELRTSDFGTTGPFRFTVWTPGWQVEYQAVVEAGRLVYSVAGQQEVAVVTNRTTTKLSDWLNEHGLTLILDGDRIINDEGLLLAPDRQREPYDRNVLIPLDWSGTDLHIESQGPTRRPDSIQARMVQQLRAEGQWDVLLDDDGSNEVADLVAMRMTDEGLLVRLVHCKYAGGEPGARLDDLYEVCGQAQKCVAWHRADSVALFKHLERRAKKRRQRTGASPFEVGDLPTLYRLQERALTQRWRFEVVIVQPGLSATAATLRQLDLLAATETYILETAAARLTVICSP